MIYFILSILAFGLWLYKEGKTDIIGNDARLCYFLLSIIIFLAAFRSPTVGADDVSFIEDYNSLNYFTFSQLYERWTDYYGYYALSKLVSLTGAPVQFWFGVLEYIYIYSIFKLIRRFSKDNILSIFVFIGIGLMTASFSYLKQNLASSFCILSFLYYIDKKHIKSSILYLMAFMSHPSALVFVFVFVIYYFRNRRRFLIYLICFVIILYMQQQLLLFNVVSIVGNDHFEMYLDADSTYTYSTFIYYSILFSLCIMCIRKFNKENTGESNFLYGACVVAGFCQLLAAFNPSLFRLANYYTPFFLLLIPNSFSILTISNRRLMSVITMFMIGFFLIYTMREKPYEFIWNL